MLEYSVPYDLVESVCYQLGQLAVRGISVIVASGDDGVGKGTESGATEWPTPNS